MRTYNELIALPTFEERYNYLRTGSKVGMDTFGFDRYFNQAFYRSKEWRRIRDHIIVRDNGCDLACTDRPILDRIYIHHMNPIEIADLTDDIEKILNPDFLVCCSFTTHNAIHYGNGDSLLKDPIVRLPNDTCPWKH